MSIPALMGHASFERNRTLEVAAATRLAEPSARIADMDLMGIAVQVVSPAPTQYHYWADRSLSERLVSLQNEHVRSLCDSHPDRFCGFGAVSLQYPDLAEKQLERLMTAGFKGVEVSTRIGERDLSDPAFERFWAAAAATGAAIFIHPLGSTLGERLSQNYLANIVGQPAETAVALAQIIFAGVLDRHPALKLIAAHGGGYLPGFLGRADHGHAVRPDAQGCAKRPSEYVRHIWFDTVVHAPEVLANLLSVAGPSQILLGTDYPYDMGEYRAAELLASTPTMDLPTWNAIVRDNARRLLQID